VDPEEEHQQSRHPACQTLWNQSRVLTPEELHCTLPPRSLQGQLHLCSSWPLVPAAITQIEECFKFQATNSTADIDPPSPGHDPCCNTFDSHFHNTRAR
jgi:hypothetical protein